jgi:hypothetical protein
MLNLHDCSVLFNRSIKMADRARSKSWISRLTNFESGLLFKFGRTSICYLCAETAFFA